MIPYGFPVPKIFLMFPVSATCSWKFTNFSNVLRLSGMFFENLKFSLLSKIFYMFSKIYDLCGAFFEIFKFLLPSSMFFTYFQKFSNFYVSSISDVFYWKFSNLSKVFGVSDYLKKLFKLSECFECLWRHNPTHPLSSKFFVVNPAPACNRLRNIYLSYLFLFALLIMLGPPIVRYTFVLSQTCRLRTKIQDFSWISQIFENGFFEKIRVSSFCCPR